ncbi:hypothetical protein ACP70R_048575 [Stipagrostis hirtigluma subsp. patula]
MDPIRPGCYAIKSCLNGKYLTYQQSDSGGTIKASGVDVVDPRARFFVEPTVNKPPAPSDILAHIRCSYNNTYWKLGWDDDYEDERCIFADAEDRTLFRVRRFSKGGIKDYCQFYSEQFYHYYIVAGESHPLSGRLLQQPLKSIFGYDHRDGNYFLWISLENQVVLPPRVCFRGDNGKYLCVPSTDGEEHSYVQFKSIDDNVYSSAMHTIDTFGDGTIRIMSEAVKKYWRRGTIREQGSHHVKDGIWVDSDGTNRNDPDILFQVLKHRDRIALKSLGNNRYCKRLTLGTHGDVGAGDEGQNILGAADEAIADEALLELAGEPLQSRVIYDLEYHLADARVYDEKTVELEGKSDGGGSQSNKLHLKLDLMQQSTWTTTVTEKEAVQTVIKGKVPFMDSNGELQLGKDDIIETIIWGESISHTLPKWEDYIVNPSSVTGTEEKVQVTATQCTYEVPFSYTQEDTFKDGKEYDPIVYNDGLYRGVNYYHIKYGHV